MKMYQRIFFGFALYLVFSSSSICQENNDDSVFSKIDAKLLNELHQKYSTYGVNVDKSVNNPKVAFGKIHDPYHSLSGRIIFIASPEKGNDIKTVFGIYSINGDSILWSVGFSPSGVMGEISEAYEINNDDKVEIVLTFALEPAGLNQEVWVFNWDGVQGKLITQLDKYAHSVIVCNTDYGTSDDDGDGIDEIHGYWKNENDETEILTFSWNGLLYGKWGKTSKYFSKVK
jgi:hypothetical protein